MNNEPSARNPSRGSDIENFIEIVRKIFRNIDVFTFDIAIRFDRARSDSFFIDG